MSEQKRLSHEFDPDTLRKIVAESITSDLPPAGFDPLAASQDELKELGFPTRPDPVRQRAAYRFWRTMFARPMQFEAFRFEIVAPAETRRRRFFSANCRGDKRASTGPEPISNPGMARSFQRFGGSFRFRHQTCRLVEGLATSIAVQHGSVSTGSVGISDRLFRKLARHRISTRSRVSRQSRFQHGGSGG